MTHDLWLAGTQRIGRVHLSDVNTRHTRTGRNGHNPQGRKKQQDDLTRFTDARPNDHQWDQGKRRHRAHEFNDWIEPTTEPIAQTHRIAQRNTNDRTQYETNHNAEQGKSQVLPKGEVAIPFAGDLKCTGPNLFRRWQIQWRHLQTGFRLKIRRAFVRDCNRSTLNNDS